MDASNVNGALDWSALKRDYRLQFAIVKATEGTGFRDPDFPASWAALKGLGLARGAYHFAHPANSPAAEAEFFLGYVRGHGLEDADFLTLDLETDDGLQPHAVAAYASAFCAHLSRSAQRTVPVYTFPAFAEAGNCAGLGSWPLWIASWDGTPGRPVIPAPWETWAVHQYSSQGVDLDVANYPDAAAMTRALGKPRPAPKPAPPEDDVQSGQLAQGPNALTVISVPWDSASNIAFGCDNGLQNLPPAKLRVAVYDTAWHVSPDVTVDCTKGQTVLRFADKARTGVISVRREDAGDAVVGWQVS